MDDGDDATPGDPHSGPPTGSRRPQQVAYPNDTAGASRRAVGAADKSRRLDESDAGERPEGQSHRRRTPSPTCSPGSPVTSRPFCSEHGDRRTGVRQAGHGHGRTMSTRRRSRGVGLRIPDSRPGCRAATTTLRTTPRFSNLPLERLSGRRAKPADTYRISATQAAAAYPKADQSGDADAMLAGRAIAALIAVLALVADRRGVAVDHREERTC